MLKFESGVEGRESPFDGGRYSVALIFECCSLSLELLFVADSTVETLSTENAELDLRHVEPAAMFWGVSSGPHHQDSGEAKIRESTAGVSRKPSSDGKARGSSSKHLCGLTAWNT